MQKVWNIIEASAAAIGCAVGLFIGEMNGPLIALVVLMCVDLVTGICKGVVTKTLSSKISFTGLLKKVLILLLVGVANIIDVYLIKDGSMIRTAVLFFYIVNEGLSVLENTVACGLPVPQKLRDVLLQFKKEGGEEVGRGESTGAGNGLRDGTGSVQSEGRYSLPEGSDGTDVGDDETD